MKTIINECLCAFSRVVATVSRSLVSIAMGTVSLYGVYEPEMPSAIIPKGEE